MDPVTMILVPGVLGGIAVALAVFRLQRRGQRPPVEIVRAEPLSTDVINMARIRVAGVGGLGLVAMAIAVAFFVPRIGQTLAAGLFLGAVFAAILILSRRRSGPLPSSGGYTGAKATLGLDARQDSTADDDHDLSSGRESLALPTPSSSRP